MKIAAVILASLIGTNDAKKNSNRVRRSHGRRHRRNNDSLTYQFKIHKNSKVDDLDPRSFLNVTQTDKQHVKTMTELGSRRFIQLKKMMDYMFQNLEDVAPPLDNFFGYGCWCIAHGENPLLAKRGLPADDVDSVCKEHALCYECARLDYGHKCDPTQKDYSIIGETDLVTGEKYLTCANEDDVCRQTLCECDKMLVEGLVREYKKWDVKYHINTSGFNGHQDCELPEPIHDWGEQDQCCGAYPHRAPFRSDNGNRQCCNNKTYHTFYLECCDGEIKNKGHCPSEATLIDDASAESTTVIDNGEPEPTGHPTGHHTGHNSGHSTGHHPSQSDSSHSSNSNGHSSSEPEASQ